MQDFLLYGNRIGYIEFECLRHPYTDDKLEPIDRAQLVLPQYKRNYKNMGGNMSQLNDNKLWKELEALEQKINKKTREENV